MALLINDLTLLIHYIIIFQKMLTNIKVVALNLSLGIFYGPGDHIMFNGLIFFHPQFIHDTTDLTGTENPQKVIFQGKKKP